MQIPSISRQTSIARGTIRLALYAACAVYGLGFVPVKTRTQACHYIENQIIAALPAAFIEHHHDPHDGQQNTNSH